MTNLKHKNCEKKCKNCNKILPPSEFHKAGKYLMSVCKKCQNILNKIRENKTKIDIILYQNILTENVIFAIQI